MAAIVPGNAPFHAVADRLRNGATDEDAAIADNFGMEERVSARAGSYAAALAKARARGADDLNRQHGEYLKNRVQVAPGVPETFTSPDLAALPAPGDECWLVHVADMTRPLADTWGPAGVDCLADEVRNLLAPDGPPGRLDRLQEIFDDWQADRDNRPVFAGFLEAVRPDADAPDWAERLRKVFGISLGPAVLAQFRYRASVVKAQAADDGAVFCAPTVLDTTLRAWFHRAKYPIVNKPAGGGGSQDSWRL